MKLSRGPRRPLRRPALRHSVAGAALLLCWAVGLSAGSAAASADTAPTARPAPAAPAHGAPAHAAPARLARPHPPASENAADPGDGTPGVVPIVLGLVLTGIAVYKHRGLPRGH